jgi:transcriptional regulatory protein LevR
VGIDSQLARRLELLRESGQVDAEIAAFLEDEVPALAEELKLELDDETFGTAITHTAMALQRARNGEAIEHWATSHAGELNDFPQAVATADRFASRAEQRLALTVPPQEREFLALHLASLTLRASAS